MNFKHNLHNFWRFALAILALSLAAQVGAAGYRPVTNAAAQAEEQDQWTAPINLSSSGGASKPRMVVDSDGTFHVIWEDEFAGIMYTQYKEGAWSDPVVLDIITEDVVPELVSGEGYIHAFWIDTARENMLLYSRVASENFGTSSAWEASRPISKYVLDFEVLYTGEGRLHLAYSHMLAEEIETAVRPEGVIYRQSVDEGLTWSADQALYTSRYFRSISLDASNLRLAATTNAGAEIVSAAWDDPLIKRIFYARSLDGGLTWQPAMEIDGPDKADETGVPFKVALAAQGANALLVWQGNLQSGLFCSQYYQASSDAGKTWGPIRVTLQNITGCPEQNHFMNLAGGELVLQTTIKDQVYFMAWDGKKWSQPQIQNTLFTFNNPVTDDPVVFRCRSSTLVDGRRLLTIGCDESVGKDIWFTSRELESIEQWFPRPTGWNLPQTVMTTDQEIFTSEGILDTQGRLHMLWVQYQIPEAGPAENSAPESLKRSLYYASWAQGQVSEPTMVLQSPEGYIDTISAALDPTRDRLAVSWNDAKSGRLYFSWSDIGRAASALEWVDPAPLPVTGPLAAFPDISYSPDGLIYISYSVPINEGRGIYVISSSDGGETWSAPVQVFDAAESSLQAVAAPRLVATGAQKVHLLWAENAMFGGAGPAKLYYAQMDQVSHTFTPAQVIFNEPVSAWWIIDLGANGLHRLWVSGEGETTNFYHDFSLDGGVTWSQPGNLSRFGEETRAVYPFATSDGGLAVVMVSAGETGALRLIHQIWEGTSWSQVDELGLEEGPSDVLLSINAVQGIARELAVFYTRRLMDQPAGEEPPWEVVLHSYQPVSGAAQTPQATAPRRVTPTVRQTQEPVKLPTSTALSAATAIAVAQPTSPATLTSPPVATPAATLAASSPATSAALQTQTATALAPTATLQLDTTRPPSSIAGNLGLILAGGIALVVTAVFIGVTRFRRRD